ncbi:Regulator of nonsense transcripts 1 [Leucoagaricus sp. SymC.cos]|nr:Regulator of nonsense transcripts 1 [Leucoagaricus sp. SymC.cos]
MLAALAIVGAEKALVIQFTQPTRRKQADVAIDIDRNGEGYQALTFLFMRETGNFFAFDMAPLAMALYQEQGLRLRNAIDIQSAFPKSNRYSIAEILKAALGDDTKMLGSNLARAFGDVAYDPDSRTAPLEPVKRAWLAQHLGSIDDAIMTYSSVKTIDTLAMTEDLLNVIAKVTMDSQRLERKKPDRTVRDFTYRGYDAKNDEHGVASNMFSNRFRETEKVRVTVEDGSGSFSVRGKVDAHGRLATFTDDGVAIGNRKILSIIGLGRDAPTAANKARDENLLRLLQRTETPNNPWLQNIWFTKDADSISWPPTWFSNASKYPALPPTLTESLTEDAKRLNPSQQIAVNAMLSKNPRNVITIVQGPPGTGKTSVIAFFVQMAVALGKTGIWLVAQSNVAVKNIAEKLTKVGFNDYRLLVSEDFIGGWHEHLYSDINKNIIRTPEFSTCGPRVKGVKVFLCTLSMLSSPMITRIFAKQYSLSTLVVDEASQIHVADYISVFYKYTSLRKACFIGDDKQLPPFGQDDAAPDALPSVFEFEHLRGHACFLNTQYRMPPQMGELISETVYNSQLNSNPHHSISNQVMAIHFVDVPGFEKMKDSSFMNEGERDVVLQLAKYLQDNKLNYKIISPYDAQRNAIETKMKNSPEGLEWANTCFNVDSFQGNEEDYIIVSLVRSKEIGFLKSQRRTNVMLTRFKKGDIASKVGSGAWLSIDDVVGGKFFGPRKTAK